MNLLTSTCQRIKYWITRRPRQDRSVLRIVLLEAPQKLGLKIAAQVNDQWFNPRDNAPRFEQFQRRYRDRLRDHFYVIVMPKTLHYLLPCLRLIPKTVNVFLILNGVAPWEEEYLRSRCPMFPIFKLNTCRYSSLTHGSVLNLLIDHNDSNFGILDHDLYVFSSAVFANLILGPNEIAVGAFKLRNQKANLEFPTTHFLFFNIALLKNLRRKYRIGAQVYFRIPPRLQSILGSLNLGYHNFLKDYLAGFDTLNLLFALALYERYTFKFLEVKADDLFHIGGTSGRKADMAYTNYLGLRFVELANSEVITRNYSSLYDRAANLRELSGQIHQSPSMANLLGRAEKAIAKIQTLT